MHAFIEHVESHLGPIQDGARLRAGISGVRFCDRPHRGSSSFLTLGLSHHVLTQRHRPGVRVEFILACKDEFVDLLNPLSVLADVCDEVEPAHSAPARGTVFGPRGKFFEGSEMEALYCAAPVYFPDALGTFTGFPEPFVLIWLVPITRPEAIYVHSDGWEAFEELLEGFDPDLLDLERRSLVESGA
jgi:hypothetical protein